MTTEPNVYPDRPPGVRVGGTERRGWGDGWPRCQTNQQVTIERTDGLRLPIRQEIAELVALLMDETERRGYDIEPGHTGGFVCRAIRREKGDTRPERPSNHSWGLAVDINWRRNPHRSRLVSDMPGWMPALWWEYKFFWGGWYRGRPDAMHYEFVGTPEDAARLTEQARHELGEVGGTVIDTTPVGSGGGRSGRRFEPYRASVEPGARNLRRGSAGDDVRTVQVALGFTGDVVDGLFGDVTEQAVREFQRRRGLEDDGVVGPQTWAEILGR